MSDLLPIAYLEAEIGGEVKQYSLATDDILHIGRSDRNELVLNNELTSRNHAMLQHSGGGLFCVTDLGSRNGTFVNGVRIAAPVILRPGDRIGIGPHQFTFHQNIAVEHPDTEGSDELYSTNVIFAESLITVLVADIHDFTGLSQRIDAAKLSSMAGALFREAGKALQAQGAWAQKYIGDAVMAVWLHKRDEPEIREMIAVLEGLSRLGDIADSLQARFELDLPVRLGAAINTGLASVGNVGSIAYSDYTALGEVVNRAFRLESSTRGIDRDVAIGERTYECLRSIAPVEGCFTPVTVRLKGYDEPTTAYATDLRSLPTVVTMLTAASAGAEAES